MKKSELRQIVREELYGVINEQRANYWMVLYLDGKPQLGSDSSRPLVNKSQFDKKIPLFIENIKSLRRVKPHIFTSNKIEIKLEDKNSNVLMSKDITDKIK